MNITKIALLSVAALVFAGCGPKSLPSDWRGAPQTGTTAPSSTYSQGEDILSDDESLTEITDETSGRDSSPAGDKVAGWVANNTIPENAKLAVIYFGFDKFNVEADQRGKLDAIIDVVKRGGENIYIVGYSDYFGTEEYNLALSDKRAQSVKNYLKNLGADDSAQIQALGEAYAVQNGTKTEVAEDRKVIVVDGNAE